MRYATYYLPNGKKIDIVKGVTYYTAKDVASNEAIGFREFPSWDDVCEHFDDNEDEIDLDETDYN